MGLFWQNKNTAPEVLSEKAKEILSDDKLSDELVKAIRMERSKGKSGKDKDNTVLRVIS